MCKNAVLLRDIIFKYDPFFASAETQKIFLRDPDNIRVERMIEQTMALVGGYKSVGDCPIEGVHKYFSDGSECKTASITSNASGTSKNSFRFAITSVRSSSGIKKTGDLRVVIYNPHLDKCHFMFIPNSLLQNGLTIRKTTNNHGELVGRWNCKKNSFSKYDYFIVDSFEELATMTTEKLRMKRNLEIAYYTGAYGAIDQFKRDAAGLYAILDENPYDINEEPELHAAFEEGVEDAGGAIF